MSKLLESVDQRTQLVGENRLELLTFRLTGRQVFGINVFKVREVLRVPPLTEVPHRHPVVCGVAHLRDQTISVIDLSAAIGRKPMKELDGCNMIVTEYNQSTQAFLVGPVDRIVNLNWEAILPPPVGAGREHFLTAITRLDDQIVEILDVERVLADIVPYDTGVSEELLDRQMADEARRRGLKVLMADDSPTAMAQVQATLANLGIEVIGVQDGLQALNQLKRWAADGIDLKEHLLMLITDAEMPEMDGYRLTHEIRSHPQMQDLYVILHTSLSGKFNQALVDKVGCDDFMSKFQPDKLAEKVQERVRDYLSNS